MQSQMTAPYAIQAKSTYSAPIFFLLSYIVFTFFPIMYRFFPFLGAMKIVLVSGVLMIASYALTHSRYTNTTAYKNPVVYAWSFLLGTMCLGMLVSFDRGLTLQIVIANLKYFLIFLVMIKITDTSERLERVLGAFALCGIGMGLSGIYAYFFAPETRMGGYRATALDTGVFADPNDLGLLLNTSLPFVAYFVMKAKRRAFLYLGMGLLIIAIMLTFSRGAFLGLCTVGIGFLLLFAQNKKKYLILIPVIAFAFWASSPPEYKERISTIKNWETDPATGKTGTRLDAWLTVLTVGLNHGILGTGAGSSFYIAGKEMGDWHLVHNSFIQVFVEAGAFAFIMYLTLFIQPYKQYKRLTRAQWDHAGTPDLRLFKILLISFMSYAATAFFLPQAYSPILFILTGIAVIQAELAKKASIGSVKKRDSILMDSCIRRQ